VSRYAHEMAMIDLRRPGLRPGEARREHVELELDPFVLGGQRYETHPPTVPVDVEITQASGAMVFDLRLAATLAGPCMRCLGYAELDLDAKAREFHDPTGSSGEALRSDYVVEDRLDVGAWARDVVALATPDQILCRPDCAGLCPVCGKDLNVEPHEHVEERVDPRWAALERLREEL
jgi:uncharacterized protein